MALYSNNIRWIQQSYGKLFRIILSKYKQRIDQKRFKKWYQRESESKVGTISTKNAYWLHLKNTDPEKLDSDISNFDNQMVLTRIQ